MQGFADSRKIQAGVANMRADGASYTDIAEAYGVSPRSVGRALAKPAVRAMLERAHAEICALTPRVVEVLRQELEEPLDGAEGRKLRLAAAKEITAIAGLSPTRDQSRNVWLTAIVAPQAGEGLHPILNKLLDRLLAPALDDQDDIVEGEVVE